MHSLESCDGELRVPKDLTYVDRAFFAGDDGCPMTLDSSTETRYLSLKYSAWSIDSIVDLGVSRLTNAGFLCDLDHMITNDPSTFQDKPSGWHENLAAVLLPQVDVPGLEEKIQQLNIVPLLDGTWTNTEAPQGRRLQRVPRPVFWPEDIDLHGSEDKLLLSVVKLQSLKSSNRRKLFERLGVETLDLQRICRAIVTAHEANGPNSFKEESVTSSRALVSHAVLLYQASWAPKFNPAPDLWFVSGDGRRRRGSDLYATTDAEEFSLKCGVSTILHSTSPRLHLDYFEPEGLIYASNQGPSSGCISSSRRDFVNYLSRTFRVSSVPRLVEKDATNSCYFSLSDDFRVLFERFHASHIFQLILDKWECYSPWIELDELHRSCEECLSSRAILLRDIRELPSEVEHGRHMKVLDIVLPDIDPLIQDGGVNLAVLDISDFKDEFVRNKLHCLGVNTRKSPGFYLRCLKAIRRQNLPSEQHLAYLYEQIQTYWEDDKDEIEYVSISSLLKAQLT